jgi:hypothetical protein
MKNSLWLFLALGLFFSNCASKKLSSSKNEPPNKKKMKNNELIEKAVLGTFPIQTDSIDILYVELKENHLIIQFAYSGGCENHSFSLIGNKYISKSLPPIRRIMLKHEANNDQCKAYIKQELKINIEEFAYKKVSGSQIILKLDGWKDRIIYTFI